MNDSIDASHVDCTFRLFADEMKIHTVVSISVHKSYEHGIVLINIVPLLRPTCGSYQWRIESALIGYPINDHCF